MCTRDTTTSDHPLRTLDKIAGSGATRTEAHP
jgi:hypothetical protein